MSGSFWKFGQDFGSQSPLAKLLNRAFIKIDDKPTSTEAGKIDSNSTDESLESNSFKQKTKKKNMSCLTEKKTTKLISQTCLY